MWDRYLRTIPSRNIFVLCIIILIIGIFFAAIDSQASGATAVDKNVKKLLVLPKHNHKKVCDVAGNKSASCNAHVAVDNSGNPLVSNTPPAGVYGPVQFHTAYSLPCTPGGAVQSVCSSPSTFGSTIAIVDAYNDPTVGNDLNTYDQAYGLPTCMTSNGCLQIVNETGQNNLPITNSGWALEISLDVQTVHDICQTCKILLVETNSSSLADLGTGENTAVQMGAVAVSNSYGGSEFNGETSYDSYYNHPGVAITASAGDTGDVVEFPSSSPYVIAVGGTSLNINTDNTYNNETVWDDTGSGCSRYETANSWQLGLSNWSLTKCGSLRGVADVSADADPNTGAAVYDSTSYDGYKGWFQVGGTSLASPLIASVITLAGGVPGSTNASSIPYTLFNSFNSHDIVFGSDGGCGTIMCNAAVGYDGPTGLGSPNGLGGFNAIFDSITPILSISPTPSAMPTPTATPTPTLTPTATPTPTLTPVPTNTPTPTPTFTISNVTVTNISKTQESIQWQTSQFGTSQVHYGKSSSSLNSTETNNSMVTSHSITLSNLTKNTTYYYYVSSKNAGGTTISSSVQSFKTSS